VNLTPGTEYQYNNGGYLLQGKIGADIAARACPRTTEGPVQPAFAL
jgi:hypothetical protein